MKSLDSIIRLLRWQLDEKRRDLAELENFITSLRNELERLQLEVDQERRLALQVGTSSATTATLGEYLKVIDDRKEKIEASLRQSLARVNTVREEINEAFQTVKRYEVVRDDRVQKANLRERRLETDALNDIAITGFLRQRASRD